MIRRHAFQRKTRGFVRRAAWTIGLLVTGGCGDGVGHPLIPMENRGGASASSSDAATSGGDAGSSGGAGSSAGSAGGTAPGGASASGAGGASSGRAGNAGSSGGERSFGGGDPGFGGDDGRYGGGGRWIGAGANGGMLYGRGPGFGPPAEDDGARSEVPASAYCAESAMWPESFEAAERSFHDAVNLLRTLGTRCAVQDRGMRIAELRMEPALRCSARLHSLDMATRRFFDRVNPDGEGPAERIEKAGYVAGIAEETIAQSEQADGASPTVETLRELVVDGGMDCEILVDPRFDSIGVGYYEGLWTIDLAGPRP